MKKLQITLAMLFCIMLFLFHTPIANAETVASDFWGDNITWTLYDDGLLIISGSGDMNYFSYNLTQAWRKYKAEIKQVVIESGVTNICQYAFKDCSNLEHIIIPEGVKTINTGAFYGCGKLDSIELPNSLVSIGNEAFYGCNDIKSITIPEGVNSIGYNAFLGCGFKTAGPIGSACDYEFGWQIVVPGRAFSGCSSLTSVLIPEGVINIGSSAFSGCSSLTNVKIPKSATVFGHSVFSDCKIQTAGPIGSDSDCEFGWLENIPASVFSGCGSLQRVLIPEGVTSIEADAFMNCENLTKITIPNSVTTIGQNAFFNCGFSSAGPIGAQFDYEYGWLTEIPEYALSGCERLTSIVISDSVTNIGDHAFDGCSNLENITIPISVTIIGTSSFNDCRNLKNIYYAGSKVEWRKINKTISQYILNNAIIHYGKDAYTDEWGGLNWTLTNSGELSIDGNGAMHSFTASGSSNAWRAYTDLINTVIINEGVTTIGDYAFCLCRLTKVTIPSSVISIGVGAFEDCNSLENINLPLNVRYIGSSAFADCGNLTDVIIPQSVISIGGSAFRGCNSIESITVPSGVRSIGDFTFYECVGLKSAIIQEEVSNISKYMFSGCINLNNITIQEGVTCIDERAFSGCTSLQSIKVPASVTFIGKYAFSECRSLMSVILSEGVSLIQENAFYKCESITSIVIPSGIENIKDSTFYHCSGLISVTIPSSVKAIGYSAFSGCVSLTDINYEGTEEEWEFIKIASGNEPLTFATVHFDTQILEPDFVLPASLEDIGEEAFSGGAFTYVKLSENIKATPHRK